MQGRIQDFSISGEGSQGPRKCELRLKDNFWKYTSVVKARIGCLGKNVEISGSEKCLLVDPDMVLLWIMETAKKP